MATSNLGLTTLATTDLLSAFPTAFNADMAILDKAMTQVTNNPIPSTSDDTPSYWHSNVPAGSYCYFTENRLTGQPIQYFIVLTLDRSGDMVQIGMAVNNKARTYRRSGTVSQGWMTPWLALDNSGDLLWTNSSATTEFDAQTITLNLSSYSSVKIHYYLHTTYTRTVIIEHPKTTGIACANTDEDGGRLLMRPLFVSSSGISFASATCSNGSTQTADNTRLIPYQIYGIV